MPPSGVLRTSAKQQGEAVPFFGSATREAPQTLRAESCFRVVAGAPMPPAELPHAKDAHTKDVPKSPSASQKAPTPPRSPQKASSPGGDFHELAHAALVIIAASLVEVEQGEAERRQRREGIACKQKVAADDFSLVSKGARAGHGGRRLWSVSGDGAGRAKLGQSTAQAPTQRRDRQDASRKQGVAAAKRANGIHGYGIHGEGGRSMPRRVRGAEASGRAEAHPRQAPI